MVPPQGSSFFQAARQGHAGNFSPWPGAPPKWGAQLEEPESTGALLPRGSRRAAAPPSFSLRFRFLSSGAHWGESRGRVGGRRSFLRLPEARFIPPKSSGFCLPEISSHLTRLGKEESGARAAGGGWARAVLSGPASEPVSAPRREQALCALVSLTSGVLLHFTPCGPSFEIFGEAPKT